ncbi:MAG: FkbM family methyltransferase [Candidatus Parvarchaeota archaeon]
MKKGKVIAIEPSPRNVKFIKNIELNNLGNVEILPFALSNQNGLVNFSGDSTGAGIMSNDKISSIQVETLTIDRILETYYPHSKNIVLKMDIEGVEELVFSNPNFLEKVREVSTELHGEKNVKSIPAILRNYGFYVEEFGLKQEVKNTLLFMLLHPISFLSAELKTNYTAFRGFIGTINGRNPIIHLASNDFKLIYAHRKS